MSALSIQDSRKRHSWRWDGHISPKSSKWLIENLTGMDGKVKQMIKIIEEDADSFARRGRPELLRLVEDFYRAYRALAVRYDHATGVIRHAHRTMGEVFPDEVETLMFDGELDGNSPFMPPSVLEFFDPDEMCKDELGIPSLDLPPVKPEFVKFRRGYFKKGVNFNHGEDNCEVDILVLKERLAKLEAEKEDGILQYQKSLERLSNLEKEIMLARDDSKKLTERAIQAEGEVELLKGALVELKAEKELVVFQYQQCLDKISKLESHILRSSSAANEVQLLKQELGELRAEKEVITAQHQQCTETISMIETKLQQAEENARRTVERAEMAESKVDNLNLAIIELTEEKESYSVQCQKYLERISCLEFQILFAQEENQRLNEEISNGEAKVKCSEDQIELRRLWTCVEEERSRFVEAETAFQTLQHLHNESQEELTVLASELQNRAQTISVLESQNLCLQEEVLKIKERNRTLDEINLSSEASMRIMQDEISSLRSTISKLEEEIGRQVQEKTSLLQEIHTFRKEFNELNVKYGTLLQQMESLELDPQSFRSSIKELHDNVAKLSDAYQIEKSEKEALLEKLEDMAKLLEKTASLEKSIGDLKSELTEVQEKVKTLEETCQILEEENSAALSEKNVLNSQIQILSAKNASLQNECQSLSSQLKSTTLMLEEMEIKCKELEERSFNSESEKNLVARNVDELRGLLESAKREHFNSVKFYQTRINSLECQLHLSQKDSQVSKNFYCGEIDKNISSEIEVSVLRECLQELHGKSSSLGLECSRVFEACRGSEKKIFDQQVELEALRDVLEIIGMGFDQIQKTIDNNVVCGGPACKYENEAVAHLQPRFNKILRTLENIKKAFAIASDENHQLVLENSILITLLEQMRLDTEDLDSEKYLLSQNVKSNAQRLLKLLSEAHVLLEKNEGLKRAVKEGTQRETTLRNTIEELKESYQALQRNNRSVHEEKKALEMEVSDLKDAKFALEEEIHDIFLVFKHFFFEKSVQVKELDESANKLRCITDTLKEVIRKLERKLEDVLTEKLCLMKTMKDSENDLKLARSTGNQLNDNISNDKDFLREKEHEISQENFKLEDLRNEQIKLLRTVEDLKREYQNVNGIKEKQAEQIRKLVEKNRMKCEENEELLGSKHCLETALMELRKKHEFAKTRELNQKSELQRWINQEKILEAEIFELFTALQISVVHETCYREKFHDLRKNFESPMTSTPVHTRFLKERIVRLEAENAGLRAHFSDYESALNSLSGSVSSLERQTVLHEKFPAIDETKDTGSVRGIAGADDSSDALGNGFPELKSFQTRIEAVGLAVGLAVNNINRLASDRSLESSVIAQASDVSVTSDNMESGRTWRLERVGASPRKTYNSEASSEITELPKDIMLDQVSACSSSYGLSKREIIPADDHMLELWGTTSKESSMNYSEARSQRLVSHSKEISITGVVIDKLEILKTPKHPHPQPKRKNLKILERLLFDAQKLVNLQKQVQDMKQKVEVAGKNNKTTGLIELDSVKEQVEEAEETIDKLFGVNHRLTRTVEDESGNSSDEGMILRKRRVLEQIRRASEKISRLNFEVQKIQFLILKLECEKEEINSKTRIIPQSPRVVRLRDYLYGGIRLKLGRKLKKRRQFCGCIRPPASRYSSYGE